MAEKANVAVEVLTHEDFTRVVNRENSVKNSVTAHTKVANAVGNVS